MDAHHAGNVSFLVRVSLACLCVLTGFPLPAAWGAQLNVRVQKVTHPASVSVTNDLPGMKLRPSVYKPKQGQKFIKLIFTMAAAEGYSEVSVPESRIELLTPSGVAADQVAVFLVDTKGKERSLGGFGRYGGSLNAHPTASTWAVVFASDASRIDDMTFRVLGDDIGTIATFRPTKHPERN